MGKVRRSGPDTARRARPVRIALALTPAGAAAPSLLVRGAFGPANSGYHGWTVP